MRKSPRLIAWVVLCALAGCGWYQQGPTTSLRIQTHPVDETSVPVPAIVESPLVVSTITSGPDAELPPYIPEDQIPLCPASDAAASAQGMPTAAPSEFDNAAPPRCRARSLDLPVNPNGKGLGPLTFPYKPQRDLTVDGNTVHVLIPCATLTPFIDYRDFMPPDQVYQVEGTMLVGHRGEGTPLPTAAPDGRYLPPTKATLVFDNSEECQ